MIPKETPITKIQFTRGRPEVKIPTGQNPFIDLNENKSKDPGILKDTQSNPHIDETKRVRAILRAKKRTLGSS